MKAICMLSRVAGGIILMGKEGVGTNGVSALVVVRVCSCHGGEV